MIYIHHQCYYYFQGTLVKTDFGKALPLVIFGTIAGLVGFLSLLNPETVNMKLPKNIDEAKKFQRYHSDNIIRKKVLKMLIFYIDLF